MECHESIDHGLSDLLCELVTEQLANLLMQVHQLVLKDSLGLPFGILILLVFAVVLYFLLCSLIALFAFFLNCFLCNLRDKGIVVFILKLDDLHLVRELADS